MKNNASSLILLTLALVSHSNKLISANIFDENKYKDGQIIPVNSSVPTKRTLRWKIQSEFGDNTIKYWSSRSLDGVKQNTKVDAPRVLLANLVANKNIAETNAFIRDFKSQGRVTGTKWALNKKGDYDFSLTIFITILWKFGDQSSKLFPSTVQHLLNEILTESGDNFRTTAPKTLGLIHETENHILMTEGSRYLKNRWMMLHGNTKLVFDNSQNGLEIKLLSFLDKMKKKGLYEFNSLPYTGYTITALLNLESFGSNDIKKAARDVLDYMNWCYALGSYHLKHYPPMRRSYSKASMVELKTDYHSLFMKAWLSYSSLDFDVNDGQVSSPHSLMAVIMDYRPSDSVVKLQIDKGNGYYVKLGHGFNASPEIYTAGKKFLLSAGGVNRGKLSLIVARPICLFIDDSANKIASIFHIAGPGDNFRIWNNTGVYKNFACAAGSVKVPVNYKPFEQKRNWSIYQLKDSIIIVAYSTASFGLMAIFENRSSTNLLTSIIALNANEEKIKTNFEFPNGEKIQYDVMSKKSRWVIQSIRNQTQQRNFDKWPLIKMN